MTAQAGHAQAGHAQAGHAPPGRAPWAASRRRVAVTALAGAALLLALALAGLATLAQEPFSAAIGASGLPGARRAQAVLRDLPLPWKAPRPAYVPPPDAAVAAGSLQPPAELPAAPPAEVSPASPASEGLPGPAVAPAPPSFKLEGFRHQWQAWNNCGPATITMATSHFGRAETQAQAAPVLKPNPNDKNVGPDELVAYARGLGLGAEWRAGGDLEGLKRLISHGIPVIVSIWITPEPNDALGHYRLLVGYDDAAGRFIAYDSFVPPGIDLTVPYAQLDEEWRVYNRTYTLVYPVEQAELVAQLIGTGQGERAMYERALAVAQAEVAARPDDAFAWFNLGTNLVALGRHGEAVPAFDRARTLRLPWRMLWYQFGPFEAYLTEGRLGDVLSLAEANLRQSNDLEESHYYRGRALQAQRHPEARAAYQAALRANPTFAPAHHALATLG